MAQGVQPVDFNSYGARRGNHEVMVRGTLANIRLRNQLAPGTEGGVTRHLPDGEPMFIYDAAMKYQHDGVPLLIVAGKEYGSGSSRDWAAKGVLLLGVRAVIAESFERIHRTKSGGHGRAAARIPGGGKRGFAWVDGWRELSRGRCGERAGRRRACGQGARREGGWHGSRVHGVVRVDTPQEVEYYRNGGILPYVLRQLAG